MSSRAKPRPWDDDCVQFARLLCEIVATQQLDYATLRESMDLNDTEINNLLDRALLVWELAKERNCPRAT